MNIKPVFWVVLFTVFTWTISTTSTAQKKESAATKDIDNSLLWEITGNGLKKPSYLFGTIHMIGKEDYFLTDVMKEKFNATEQLALEIDMDNLLGTMMSMISGMMMKDGTTLKDLLTKEEYAKLEKHITEKIGLPMMMLDRMKPMLVSTLLSEGAIEGDVVSYEAEFLQMAKTKNMETLGLETAEYQLSIFDSIPYKAQAKMLVEALDGEGDMGEDMFNEMVKYYKAQDLNALYKIISQESEDFGDYQDLLLNNRNRNWIPVIGKYAKDKPTFFAVGAGHLPGEVGVINLLRKAGYTVKAIR